MSPNQPKTPLRALRVPDELWDAAKVEAAKRGESVSEAIRGFLERYSRVDVSTLNDSRQPPSRSERA